MTEIGERGVCGGLLERIRSKLDLVLGCFFLASERIMDYGSIAMIPHQYHQTRLRVLRGLVLFSKGRGERLERANGGSATKREEESAIFSTRNSPFGLEMFTTTGYLPMLPMFATAIGT